MNTLLNLKDGESIHAFQTRLFVKRCLYDELLIKQNKIPKESWNKSYLIDKVFGSNMAKFTNYVKMVQGKVNKIKDKFYKKSEN